MAEQYEADKKKYSKEDEQIRMALEDGIPDRLVGALEGAGAKGNRVKRLPALQVW